MLKSSSSKKKLVKPLKNCFLDPMAICIEKGSLWTTPKMKKNVFGRNNKSRSSAFRKFLFYIKISCYEFFSIFSEVMFSVKKVSFPAKTAVQERKVLLHFHTPLLLLMTHHEKTQLNALP